VSHPQASNSWLIGVLIAGYLGLESLQLHHNEDATVGLSAFPRFDRNSPIALLFSNGVAARDLTCEVGLVVCS
jgi:hypothetical protein